MKKILITIILTTIISTNISIAQNIGDIQASFCNINQNTKEIDLVTQANQDTDICINFRNNSLQDTTISIDFVDGAITPNGKKACFSADKPKTNFGQYIQNYEQTLTIPAQSNIQQHFKIKYPVGFSGVSHGCLAYSINSQSNIAGGISMILRKVHTIDILVGGTNINSNINMQQINMSGDYISNRLTFTIKNNGNINQTIQISGTISNLFGFEQKFYTDSFNINTNETKTINSNILSLPDYKGIFFVKSTLSYQPNFNFDITNHNIPNQYTIPGSINISKTIMIRNWFYIISLILIITLTTIIIIKPKK